MNTKMWLCMHWPHYCAWSSGTHWDDCPSGTSFQLSSLHPSHPFLTWANWLHCDKNAWWWTLSVVHSKIADGYISDSFNILSLRQSIYMPNLSPCSKMQRMSYWNACSISGWEGAATATIEFQIVVYFANGKRQMAIWRRQLNKDKLTKCADKSRIAQKFLREV